MATDGPSVDEVQRLPLLERSERSSPVADLRRVSPTDSAEDPENMRCERIFFSPTERKFVHVSNPFPVADIPHFLSQVREGELELIDGGAYPYYWLNHSNGANLLAFPCQSGCAFRMGNPEMMYNWLWSQGPLLAGRMADTEVAEQIEVPDRAVVPSDHAFRFITSFVRGDQSLSYSRKQTGNQAWLKSQLSGRPREIFCRWRLQEFPLTLKLSSGRIVQLNDFGDVELSLPVWLEKMGNGETLVITDGSGKSLRVEDHSDHRLLFFQNFSSDAYWAVDSLDGTALSASDLGNAAIEWSVNGELTSLCVPIAGEEDGTG